MDPADIKKAGAAYDLPIAVGMLAASEQISSDKLSDYLLMGELYSKALPCEDPIVKVFAWDACISGRI